MRRMAVGAVLMAVSLVATGCGDDGSDAPTAGDETTDAETTDAETTDAEVAETPSEGACELVTTDAVAEAFGEPAELVEARPYVCEILVGDVSLTVQRMDGGVDPESATVTACGDGTRVEVQAGDAAHVCMTEAFPAPFGAVSRGDVAVWIGTPARTDEAVRDRIAALLPLVTVPG